MLAVFSGQYSDVTLLVHPNGMNFKRNYAFTDRGMIIAFPNVNL